MWPTSLEKRLGRERPRYYLKMNVCFVCLKCGLHSAMHFLFFVGIDAINVHSPQFGAESSVQDLFLCFWAVLVAVKLNHKVFPLSAVLGEFLSLKHCIQIISDSRAHGQHWKHTAWDCRSLWKHPTTNLLRYKKTGNNAFIPASNCSDMTPLLLFKVPSFQGYS